MELPTLDTLNLAATVPIVFLTGWALLLLVVDLFIPASRKHWSGWLAILGLVAAGVGLVLQTANVLGPELPAEAFFGMAVVDGFAVYAQIIVVVAAIFGILLALEYLPKRRLSRGEYYTLLLFSTIGMMLMAMASDLILIFVALELLSIPLYILTGFDRYRTTSEEGAMKYFLLGAFSSAFLVYGVALTYGGTGTTALTGVLAALGGDAPSLPLAIAGVGLVVVGLGFKVAAVPFHMWTPDVYEGAPTPVTAFMSVGSKVGGFAALMRVLIAALPELSGQWGVVIAIIAILTMIVGNFLAISQRNIKRMLAYSSIALAGYILVAVAAAQVPEAAPMAVSAAIFYMLTYAFTNLGAFGVVIAVENEEEPDSAGVGPEIEDFAGLGRTRPLLGAMMTLFMLSLTGMPISAGLVGKFFVFQAAVQASSASGWMLAAAIVGVITSVISAFYYLRVPMAMYMYEGEGRAYLQPALGVALIVTALGTLLLGVIPTPLFELAQQALLTLAG